jgi:thiol:disulfide interchange protein/DsbC/DsbD-like thiol-disulfide interchange protein
MLIMSGSYEDAKMIARTFGLLIALAAALLFGQASPAGATEAMPSAGGSDNVKVELLSERALAAPGETFHLVVKQTIAPGWHTYWRNPGDSGEPTDITWTSPPGVTIGPIQWPAPTAIPFGPLVNYGYSKQVLLPITVTVPASARVGNAINLMAKVRWLECADICIPGEAEVGIGIDVARTPLDNPNAAQLTLVNAAIGALPTPFQGTTILTDLGSAGLQMVIKGTDTPSSAYFFPYEIKTGALVDFAQPQELVRGKDGFGLTLVKSPSFPADLVGPVGGVLVLGQGSSAKAYEVQMNFDAAPKGSASQTPAIVAVPTAPSSSDIGLLLALGMAFLGGLILNLMPCVFPILSMKALGLIEASHTDAKSARAHGLWYGAGVIASFLALSGVLIAAQAAGAAIGWGFQLQNPAIVISLSVIMTLIGFNLMGFFEIGSSLQNIGGGRARGSFLTGILAVVVAAPCTAPLMGAALGFAASQPPPIALLVFAALGLGFALPFVALTFAPALLRALPRPGPWMVRLREALAFPMFATAIWLIWVASAQAGQAGVLAALVGVLGAGLGVWIARTWRGVAGKSVAIVTILAALVWAGFHVTNAPMPASKSAAAGEMGEAWSPQRVAELSAAGNTVFVNFTADWCVTCKVNEVGVFSDARVKAALSGEKTAYLVADWTSRDAAIAQALASHGRIGVPLYLVYKPSQASPTILPQLLTADVILDAIK